MSMSGISCHTVSIQLADALYAELCDAARDCAAGDTDRITPEKFAEQCVESVLASRRMKRISHD